MAFTIEVVRTSSDTQWTQGLEFTFVEDGGRAGTVTAPVDLAFCGSGQQPPADVIPCDPVP